MSDDTKSASSRNPITCTGISTIFRLPSRGEIQACWELCRLHNNMGFWVIWAPTVWSISMVYHAQQEIKAITAIGRIAAYIPLCLGIKSLIMTIDDILDSDIDRLVIRTKLRPLPREAISIERAWLFFSLQTIFGLCLAFKFLSTAASLMISMTVWPLYIIYPTCKRWTSFAPVVLGVMFKVGVFMGWADLTIDGSISWNILTPVYLSACLWTITYETVYQHEDKLDDARIGINSLALLLGKYTKVACSFTAIGFILLLSYGGALNDQGPIFFSTVLLAAIILIPKLLSTNLDHPFECQQFFLRSRSVGLVIVIGFVVDAVYHRVANGIPL
ncbi:UbiA prenyltransferase [Crucibulum laeve]|uniref:UbiA prenyltransferase n=1 Tax=Crucibulum laeve TaxID=68775 RepID=A0A5C3M6B5_9AGAR|nr:UbiA prenyltransferase [Crucibulum laeve]